MRHFYKILFLVAILTASACTPLVQKAHPDIQEPVLTKSVYEAADGYEMPYRHWSAGAEEKAILIAVHGLNDYSNAFAFPASWWMQNGITTFAYDQRGFGETDEFGIWPGEEKLINDLITFVGLVKSRHPGKPVFILGESLGGAVTMSSVVHPDMPEVDGVILSAPGVWGWQSLNLFYRSVLWVSAHLFPEQTLTGRGLGIQASDNISMLRNLGADDLFIKETRISVIYGSVNLMARAYDAAEQQRPPLLLMYGANDEIIPKPPVEEVARRLPKGADIVMYPEGWHLLMRDLQAPVVWKDIKSWIESREIASNHQVTSLPLFKD